MVKLKVGWEEFGGTLFKGTNWQPEAGQVLESSGSVSTDDDTASQTSQLLRDYILNVLTTKKK